MKRRQIYFRDTNTIECWTCLAGVWSRSNDRYAFDDLPLDQWDYFVFDSKPANWLGDRRENPMPYIQW